ncbi:MAG: transcription-repair coupling factor [Lachnospiraceae bacterium]|nr:transcription-repair coupling factor [Lachnospiraceae bacterium]MDY5742041.1 transcription-repair coupling factor [Lachnospiraceae bacterium]
MSWTEQAVIRTIENKLALGAVSVSGASMHAAGYLAGLVGNGLGRRLVITYSEERATVLEQGLRLFGETVVRFPEKDLLFYAADIHGDTLLKKRLEALRVLARQTSYTVIATAQALTDGIMSSDQLQASLLRLQVGEEYAPERLIADLLERGYERVERVEAEGQFSARGGLIDIVSYDMEYPLRVEYFDDEIDSLRLFQLENMRSLESLSSAVLLPAAEHIISEMEWESGLAKVEAEVHERLQIETDPTICENLKLIIAKLSLGQVELMLPYFKPETGSLLSYFSPTDSLVILDDPLFLQGRMRALEEEMGLSLQKRIDQGLLLAGAGQNLKLDHRQWIEQLSAYPCMLLGEGGLVAEWPAPVQALSVDMTAIAGFHGSVEALLQQMLIWKKKCFRMLVVSPSLSRARRLAEHFLEAGFTAYASEPDRELPFPQPGEVIVTVGDLQYGFQSEAEGLVILGQSDIFGQEKETRKAKKSKSGAGRIKDLGVLQIGDYVIHENHGLGIFRGIEKIRSHDQIKDFLKIEYADNGALYIPVTDFDLLMKYGGHDMSPASLNKLGGNGWRKTKQKARAAIWEMAKELVELYAARLDAAGYQAGEDTVWQKEFEELFPYEETDDQLRAVEDIKADMRSPKIMDRLLCGDVGYGKTEVAMRAAFKAIQEGYQVMYLVPTTILAQQHYRSFTNRFENFPVRVDLLNRFVTGNKAKESLKAFARGTCDILIGTHRILSEDVTPRKLGLLIIDEEQRFGVKDKEKIKSLKTNVDVLTLTATPIPRTLHMSLIGIRDLSMLEEAPRERHAIQTYITEQDDELIREAVVRELSRGGQVYYVCNRVEQLDSVVSRLRTLLPEARIGVGHGQMHKQTLEKVMLSFINGELDILVATTIIETGLDIPNVNTIIIQDAHRMGLSQLYQLRGRVGRSSRIAYAFLLYPRAKVLSEVAMRRLSAIREFTRLGSGVQIAMKDLEIRGSGNVLGMSQHGHMQAIGYDLYCKLLGMAIRKLRGETVNDDDFEVVLELRQNLYIPDTYIESEKVKLEIYREIAAVDSEEAYSEALDMLIDRFGDPPKQVVQLLRVAMLRHMAARVLVDTIIEGERELQFRFCNSPRLKVEKLPEFVSRYHGRLSVFVPKDKKAAPILKYRLPTGLLTADIILDEVQMMLTGLQELAED